MEELLQAAFIDLVGAAQDPGNGAAVEAGAIASGLKSQAIAIILRHFHVSPGGVELR